MTASTDVAQPGRPADGVHAGRLFARTCAAEWTRLRTVRGTWWFLAAASVIMVGLGAVAGNDAAGEAIPPQGEPAWQAAAIAALPAQFALLALALTAVTADYATAGIVPALQWTPRRSLLLAARVVVAAAVATILGVALAVASSLAAFASAGGVLSLPLDEGLDVLSSVAFVFGVGTVFASGLAFLLRHTAGVLVTVFLVMLVLPLMLPNFGYEWTTKTAENLPGTGAAFLLLGEARGMTQTSAALTMLVWAGAALLLGWLRMTRQDANR